MILGLFVFDFFAHVRAARAHAARIGLLVDGLHRNRRRVRVFRVVALGRHVRRRVLRRLRHGEGAVGRQPLRLRRHHGEVRRTRVYQQKVLLLGIVMALVMRGVFIAAGAAAIARYSWVFYLFGVILILTAINMLRESDEPAKEGRIERFAKRHLRTSEDYDGDKLFTRVDGRRMATRCCWC